MWTKIYMKIWWPKTEGRRQSLWGSSREGEHSAELSLFCIVSHALPSMSVILPLSFTEGMPGSPADGHNSLLFLFFFLVICVPVIPLVPVFLMPISFMLALLSLYFSCHLTLLILSPVTLVARNMGCWRIVWENRQRKNKVQMTTFRWKTIYRLPEGSKCTCVISVILEHLLY